MSARPPFKLLQVNGSAEFFPSPVASGVLFYAFMIGCGNNGSVFHSETPATLITCELCVPHTPLKRGSSARVQTFLFWVNRSLFGRCSRSEGGGRDPTNHNHNSSRPPPSGDLPAKTLISQRANTFTRAPRCLL
jgi:hypothetical protein